MTLIVFGLNLKVDELDFCWLSPLVEVEHHVVGPEVAVDNGGELESGLKRGTK